MRACVPYDDSSVDTLMCTVWYYHSLICEKKDMLPSIRPRLLAAYRTSVLTRHETGQAAYLNLCLRNYLTPSGGELRLVDQADKLVQLTKSSFPESASNNQYARYFYYIGMIKTIQLEYTEGLNYLQVGSRPAPSPLPSATRGSSGGLPVGSDRQACTSTVLPSSRARTHVRLSSPLHIC